MGFDLPGFRHATSFLREISERDPVMEEFSESSVRFNSTDPEDMEFRIGAAIIGFGDSQDCLP